MISRWVVSLLREPTAYAYHRNYFPRYFAYKKDALNLVEEVKKVGGLAQCHPFKNSQTQSKGN